MFLIFLFTLLKIQGGLTHSQLDGLACALFSVGYALKA